MKRERFVESIYAVIFTSIVSLAMLLSVCDAFAISYQPLAFYLVMIVGSVFSVLLFYRSEKKLVTAMGALLAGEGILWIVGRAGFTGSVRYVIETAVLQFRVYLLEGKYADIVRESDQTLGVLGIGVFFIVISVCGMLGCKRIYAVAGMIGGAFLLPFLTGTVPRRITLFLTLIGLMGAVFGRSGKAKGGEKMKVAMVGILAGSFAFLIGIPLLSEKIKPMIVSSSSAQERIEAFWDGEFRTFLQNFGKGDTATGGVNDGTLGKYDELETDHSVHLKVYADKQPHKKVYIRGFVGGSYTGKAWRRGREKQFDVKTDSIEVENVKANRKYQYHTYPDEDDIPSKWQQKDSAYEKSVRKNYLSVPSRVEEAFEDVVKEHIIRTEPENISWEITELLREDAEYSLSPGKTPAGEDFAEYFFFQNKKGYCTHFATTAVLLFRMKQIPARYVGGYVVKPEQFERQKKGTYYAEVTGEEAHAWAEIYLSGKGWIPIETTPGYVGNSSQSVDEEFDDEEQADMEEMFPEELPSQEEAEPEQNEEIEETDGETDDEAVLPSEDSPTSEGKQNTANGKELQEQTETKNTFSKYKTVICVAILGIILVGIIFINLCKRKKNEIRKKGYSERTKQIFYKIYQKLVSEKLIAPEMDLDDAFVEILSKRCGQEEEKLKQILDIVYRANYGKEEVEKEEYLFVKRLLLLLEKRK